MLSKHVSIEQYWLTEQLFNTKTTIVKKFLGIPFSSYTEEATNRDIEKREEKSKEVNIGFGKSV
jgi:hypothetical protein